MFDILKFELNKKKSLEASKAFNSNEFSTESNF
jgi:hypothetical protein